MMDSIILRLQRKYDGRPRPGYCRHTIQHVESARHRAVPQRVGYRELLHRRRQENRQ